MSNNFSVALTVKTVIKAINFLPGICMSVASMKLHAVRSTSFESPDLQLNSPSSLAHYVPRLPRHHYDPRNIICIVRKDHRQGE
jgi:hypothetical protein